MMKESQPTRQNLSAADQAQLDKLKVAIDRAIADGLVSKDEYEQIKRVMWADGKVAPAELDLINELIHQRIARGELAWEWS